MLDSVFLRVACLATSRNNRALGHFVFACANCLHFNLACVCKPAIDLHLHHCIGSYYILANHLHSAIAIFGNMSSSMVGFLSSFFLLQISSTNVTPVTQESWVRITTKHTFVLWTPFFILLALLLRAATLDPTMLPAEIQIVYLTRYHEGKSRHGMVKCAAYHYTIAHCVCAVTWYDEVSGSSFCRTSLLLGCQHHF